MRHQRAGRKLGRTASHRKAMLKNMLASIFAHEKIETTTPKAKELKPLAEKMITLGKRGDLHARRRVLQFIADRKIVHKLFAEIAPRYQERHGGYTRIIKTGFRPGDNAPLSIIELLREDTRPKRKKSKKKAAQPAAESKKGRVAAAAQPQVAAEPQEETAAQAPAGQAEVTEKAQAPETGEPTAAEAEEKVAETAEESKD